MATIDGWKNETMAGFAALARGRYADAAHRWSVALNFVIDVEPHDPRRAAALSNLGAGRILAGQQAAAIDALDQSAQAWRRVASRIGTVDVPVTGTSSAFHFRLASRHLAAFQNARRKRLSELCAASLAITQFNRACAQPSKTADIAQAANTLAEVLSRCLGPHAPEVRMLKPPCGSATSGAPIADAPYAEKFAALAARRSERSDAFATIETACALTALVTPFAIATRDQETGL